MAAVEERVAFLEGSVEEHSHMMDGMRDALNSLEARMDRRFEAIDRRFETIDGHLSALDQKVTRHFFWLVGILVTTLATVIGTMAR